MRLIYFIKKNSVCQQNNTKQKTYKLLQSALIRKKEKQPTLADCT